MKPEKKQPLFIVTGASGVGKSTMCNLMMEQEETYIVMESDLLWHDMYNTPEDNYLAYRRLWMRVCATISKIGMPVVLCGCAVPEQFENQPERDMFSEMHYLAVVCDDATLEHRMRNGRNIHDATWLQSSLDFNRWLKQHAGTTSPAIHLLDTTQTTPAQAATQADAWIRHMMKKEALHAHTVPI